MKKLFGIILGLVFVQISLAQAPQKMSYQSVIRDANNALVSDVSVGIQLSIVQGSPAGTAVFVEVHAPTTNANGLASVEIGSGIPISGTLGSIDWGNGPYYIKSETDPAGGTNYTLSGTTELLSVPYALYAANAGGDSNWTLSGNVLSSDKAVGIGTTAPFTSFQVGDFVDQNDRYITIATPGGNTKRAGIRLRHFDQENGFLIESDERSETWGLNFIDQTFFDSLGTSRLFIQKGTGNLGVNTTSPSSKLHVKADDEEVSLKVETSGFSIGPGSPKPYPASIDIKHENTEFKLSLENNGSLTISDVTSEVPDMTVFNGRVGIGGPTSSLAKLNVDGTLRVRNTIRAFDGEGIQFKTEDAVTRLTMANNGRIKIGNPAGFYQGQLHVYSQDDTRAAIFTEGGALSLAASSFQDLTFGHQWLSSIDQQMTLNPAGNLGVGATLPQNRLHVASTIAGPWDNSDAYTARIDFPIGGNGLIIRADQGTINEDVSFVTFGTGGGNSESFFKAGRIRGFDYPADFGLPPVSDPNFICALNSFMGGGVPTDPLAVALVIPQANLIATCNNGGVIYESAYGDYAEYLERQDPNEKLYVADIVGVKGGKISRNTDGAEQFMSISLAPIVLGNMPQDDVIHNYDKVGFMGQVPVKVRGKVKSGDYIIPSGRHDGEGLAIAPEDLEIGMISQIVGRSWTSSEHEGMNIINIVVGVKSFEIVEVLKKERKRLDNLEAMVQALQEKNDLQSNALVENTKILKKLQGILEAEAKR